MKIRNWFIFIGLLFICFSGDFIKPNESFAVYRNKETKSVSEEMRYCLPRITKEKETITSIDYPDAGSNLSSLSIIGGLNEIVQHRENGMKSYAGNPNSIADSILELLYDHQLAANIVKKAKNKVRNEYNWSKIAQDTHFTYQKAICQSMAEKQKREIEQERARKTKSAKNTEKEITNLLSFKKRHAYA